MTLAENFVEARPYMRIVGNERLLLSLSPERVAEMARRNAKHDRDARAAWMGVTYWVHGRQVTGPGDL